MAAKAAAAHNDPQMIDEHVHTLAVHGEKIDSAEDDIEDHGSRLTKVETAVITIHADLKASRHITITSIALVGVALTALQLILHVVGS